MTIWARAGGNAWFKYTFLTQKERDNETGLDFFEARYYSNVQGRFTSVDPLTASARVTRPQSWNRYTYCVNNPLALVDPSGLDWGVAEWDDDDGVHHTDYRYFTGEIGEYHGHKYTAVNFGGDAYKEIETTNEGTVIISNDPCHLKQVVPPLTVGDVLWGLGNLLWRVGTPGYDDEFANDYQSRMAGIDPVTGESTARVMGGTFFIGPLGVNEPVVLGQYPEYLQLGEELGAKTFNIPEKIWAGMSESEQWAANQRFLDRAIERGSEIRLSNPIDRVRPGSSFEKEISYLTSKGYTVSADGTRMIPPK